MAKQQPLYQDKRLVIDYLPQSPEDYQLIIKRKSGEETGQILQRGVLGDLAKTSRERLETKIDTINPVLLHELRLEKIGMDWLHVALCQAHMEEERRLSDSAAKMRAKSCS